MTNMYLRKWSIASCCCSSWLVRWPISKENVWQRGIPGICVPVRWRSISTTDLENKRKLLCPFHLETDQCTHWYKWNYSRASAINLNPLPFEKQIIICIWPSANPGDQKAKPSFKGQNLLSWFQSPGHAGWWRGLNTHLFSWLFSANLLPCNLQREDESFENCKTILFFLLEGCEMSNKQSNTHREPLLWVTLRVCPLGGSVSVFDTTLEGQRGTHYYCKDHWKWQCADINQSVNVATG